MTIRDLQREFLVLKLGVLSFRILVVGGGGEYLQFAVIPWTLVGTVNGDALLEFIPKMYHSVQDYFLSC